MPFRRVVEKQEASADEAVRDLAGKLKPILAKIDVVSVRRYRAGSKKPQVVGTPIEVRLGDEEHDVFATDIAHEAIAIATEDAAGKRSRYAFVVLAPSLGADGAAEILSHDAWIEDDFDTPVGSIAHEHASFVRQHGATLNAQAEAHVKLMNESTKMLGAVVKVVTDLSNTIVNGNNTAWQADVYRDAMRYEHDLNGATLIANMQKAQSRHRMWAEIVSKVAPFGERIADAVAGAKKNVPTREELDKVFGENSPEMRDAALAWIAAPAAEKKACAERMKAAWEALGQLGQANALKRGYKVLGEARANEIAMWIGMVFKE